MLYCRKLVKGALFTVIVSGLFVFALTAQNLPNLRFYFDDSLKSADYKFKGGKYSFEDGIDGKALKLSPEKGNQSLALKDVVLDEKKDFSVQFWIKTESKQSMVLLSQKKYSNKGVVAQKSPGWALFSSNGTLSWTIGSGGRRINYERDNVETDPINDGKWHLISLTYNKALSEFRLYFDGINKAIYKVHFNFSNNEPLVIGTQQSHYNYSKQFAPEIFRGQKQLQAFVDEFNRVAAEPLKNDEYVDLIVNPHGVFESKQKKGDLAKALKLRNQLGNNFYTVFQNRELTELKPVSQVYFLKDGKVAINSPVARKFTENERLFPADFVMDNLVISNKTLSGEEVFKRYSKHKNAKSFEFFDNLKKFNVGVWNIWHGGIHWSKDKDGWDSRKRIVDMVKEKELDVVLLQETYSSGDYIAAELGYYYATTSDWDYCFQGANISVISRYPIKEVQVSKQTEFNNVAVKLAISKSQEVWAMSNWYGMGSFPAVFDFHKKNFDNSDKIPVLFGGDFNAVPHTDGGNSPASLKLMEGGFTDAYRSKFLDVEKYPGYTHKMGKRIDQLYYKGKGLSNSFTEVISTWPTGFPSDHYLIISKFDLNY